MWEDIGMWYWCEKIWEHDNSYMKSFENIGTFMREDMRISQQLCEKTWEYDNIYAKRFEDMTTFVWKDLRIWKHLREKIIWQQLCEKL